MNFAVLGDHPDGLDMARALVESGRHGLAVYSGPIEGAEILRRWGISFKSITDLEEVLADPRIEAVIVAGRPANRPEQLRRALQSERHVLCVQPVDTTPDTAYEAAMIQADTGRVLLPLLPEAFHPGILRLAEMARNGRESSLGEFRLVEMERWSLDRVLIDPGGKRPRPSLPGWDVLRTLGGEIAEIFAFARGEEVDADQPLLLSGAFEERGLFQAAFLSGQHEARWRLGVVGRYSRADLVFAQGWPGPARLTWRDETGEVREETWETWNPWPTLVEVFERVVVGNPYPGTSEEVASGSPLSEAIQAAGSPRPPHSNAVPRLLPPPNKRIAWQDAIRLLELDDAARRSVAKRRASALEYQEATEEAGFKGTMTLFGCGLLWMSILLVILANWIPAAAWVIAPLFGVFLLLQLLRWVVK